MYENFNAHVLIKYAVNNYDVKGNHLALKITGYETNIKMYIFMTGK